MIKVSKIRVTKSFSFEMAHALWNYDGPCKNIHGHSYKLWVTIKGSPKPVSENRKQGMVIDFHDLKRIVNESIIKRFDHSVVINKKAPHAFLNKVDQMFEKYEITEYQPTSENLIIEFAKILKPKFKNSVELFSIRLQETETSYAEWYLTDNV